MHKAILILCMLVLAKGQSEFEENPSIVPETTSAPIPDNSVSIQESNDTVHYFKHIISVLDTKEAQELAEDLREEFNLLNSDGTLGLALHALFELRLEDLLTSVKQHKKLKTVLDRLTNTD